MADNSSKKEENTTNFNEENTASSKPTQDFVDKIIDKIENMNFDDDNDNDNDNDNNDDNKNEDEDEKEQKESNVNVNVDNMDENKNDIYNNNNKNESYEVIDDSIGVFLEHGEPIYALSFKPESYDIVSGGGDDFSYVWNIQNNLKSNLLHNNDNNHIENNDEDEMMEDNDENETIENQDENENIDNNDELENPNQNDSNIDVNKKKYYKHRLGNHKDTVIACEYSKNGKYIASASMDSTINVYNSENGKFLCKIEGPAEEIEFISWHPKHDVLIAGCRDTTLWLWHIVEQNNNGDKNSVKVKVLNVFSGHLGPILCGGFTKNGKYAYSGSQDGSMFIWDLKNNNAKHHLKGGKSSLFHESSITCIDDKFESPILMSGSEDHSLILTNYESGKILKVFKSHKDSIECIAFNEKITEYVMSCSLDNTVKIWDISKLTMRSESIHEDSVIVGKWFHTNENKALFATATLNGTIYVWDSRNGQPIKRFRGHRESIHCIDISYDDKYIVSGGDDGCALIFSK